MKGGVFSNLHPMDHSPHYHVNGEAVSPNNPRFQDLLASAYNSSTRPRCLCVPGGVEMYVARFKSFVIKRMPDTGDKHHPTCPSYEPPPGQSGLGEVLGEAVIERTPELVEVRLDFPLTRRLGRPFPPGEPSEQTEVTAPRKKIGLRGLLHLLWDRAGFNRWYPRMEGRRSWGVVQRHLMEAAESIETKGVRLPDRLYIPEQFRRHDAALIARRRAEAMAILVSPSEDVQFKMMIVIGEVKDLSQTEMGYRLVLRHMGDCPLFMDAKTGEKLKKVFSTEYEAWSHDRLRGAEATTPPHFRLVFAGLVYAKRENVFCVDTATLMLTTENWVPLDYAYEQILADTLRAQHRRFLKPLRYESKTGASFPNFVLLDSDENPVALDIVSAFMSDNERAAKELAIKQREPQGWTWRTGETIEPPPLPGTT